MKRILKYLCIIILGISPIIYVNSFHLPIEIHISVFLRVAFSCIMVMVFFIFVSILVMSYIINILKYIYFLVTKKQVLVLYLFPIRIEFLEKRIYLTHPFALFYNQTTFHVPYINCKEYTHIRKYLSKLNQYVLFMVMIILTLITILLSLIWYYYSILFFCSSMLYLLSQADNTNRNSSGVLQTHIDETYMIQFISRQSSIETVRIDQMLLYQWIDENKYCENVYFVNCLLINLIMDQYAMSTKEKENLISYKLDEIFNEDHQNSYLYHKSFQNTLDIKKRVLYENFDLLIIIAYYLRKFKDIDRYKKIYNCLFEFLQNCYKEDVEDNIFQFEIIKKVGLCMKSH